MNGTIRIDEFVRLLPMHLVLDGNGQIVSAGPTLRKLIGPARRFDEAFVLERPHVTPGPGVVAGLLGAASDGRRLFLRLVRKQLLLRGHAIATASGERLILNLGFGIALPQAVRQFDLTDADFAPSELAMELLFLYEANSLAGSALADANESLDVARREAERRSSTDPLTGLANRRGLEEALDAVVDRLHLGRAKAGERRHGGGGEQGFALLHLDLDHFKEVNDGFGHAAGDSVLRHIAGVLLAETRAEDTVARSGGDEFVLLLPGMCGEAELMSFASRIIDRIEAPIPIDGGNQARVSASIGIVLSVNEAEPDLDRLAAQADAALYDAKRAGRGRAAVAGRAGWHMRDGGVRVSGG